MRNEVGGRRGAPERNRRPPARNASPSFLTSPLPPFLPLVPLPVGCVPLSLEPERKAVIVSEETLIPVLVDIIVERFGGRRI